MNCFNFSFWENVVEAFFRIFNVSYSSHFYIAFYVLKVSCTKSSKKKYWFCLCDVYILYLWEVKWNRKQTNTTQTNNKTYYRHICTINLSLPGSCSADAHVCKYQNWGTNFLVVKHVHFQRSQNKAICTKVTLLFVIF